ncbi:MAG: TatD family hydrolase [bacterium]|nr:TatD family hydrolase [bacterium]
MTSLKLFDVHTHVQFAAFEKDYDAVIRRALGGGVWLVNVGTQKDTSASAVKIAEQFSEGVYATVGLHPIHTEKSYHDEKELGVPPFVFSNSSELENSSGGFKSRGLAFVKTSADKEDFDYKYYKKLALHPKVVAIGECGLDYYRLEPESKKKQEEVFIQHVELSHEVKKPLMIHCRDAFGDLVKILDDRSRFLNSRPGIIHFFSGNLDNAKKLLNLGFSFSFGGVITFTRDYDEVIKYLPLDRILLETDAPYVTPIPYRGKRNEPAYIAEVAKKLADIKGVPFEEVADSTTKNSRSMFVV